MNLSKKFFTLLMLVMASITGFSQTKVNLALHNPLTTPVGSTFNWYSATPVSTSTILSPSLIAAAPAGTYYGAYTDNASSPCYSPAVKVDVVTNICPATTADITAKLPAGSTMEWHTTATPSTSDLVTNTAALTVGAGTYIAYNNVAGVYTYANEVAIVTIIPTLAAPTATSGGDQIACETSPIQTLTATATGNTVTWYNAASGGSVVASPTLSATGTITYYAQNSDPSYCPSTTRTAVTLTINPKITFTATPTQITCNGGTGSVVLASSGGTGTLTYSGDATTALTAGTYNYTVTDANGCTATASATINAAPSAITFTATPTQITCNGGTGSVVLAGLPSGAWTINQSGTAATTYSSNTSSYTVSGLTGGTYAFTVTSAAGCISTSTSNVVLINAICAIADVYPTQTPSTTLPTTVGNVTDASGTGTDTINGVAVTTLNTDVTPVTAGPLSIDKEGVLTLAASTPSGSYPITYTICEVDPTTGLAVSPANCSTVTDTIIVLSPIVANIDTATVPAGGTVSNVVSNDTLNGQPAVIGNNVNLTGASVPAGLTLNPDGTITIGTTTPSGSYPITYTICEIIPVGGAAVSPANCSTVTNTIIVLSPIVANVDTATVPAGGTVPNVVSNDTLNGQPAVIGNNVNLTGASVPAGLTLNPDGTITVDPFAVSGTYTVVYTICEIGAVPANCATATATVKVTVIQANPDVYSVLPGTNTQNVIINDTLNGSPTAIGIGAGQVTLTSTPKGPLTMNPDGTIAVVVNTPAGTYPINYTICEANKPANCSTTTATVTVNAEPSIKVIKTGVLNDLNSDGFQEIGETITYSFAITNTGNVPLTNVVVTDPLPGIAMTGTPISLAIGETNKIEFQGVYTLTKEDMIRGSVANQATVFGTPPSGPKVSALSSDSDDVNPKPTVKDVKGCVIEVFNAVSPNQVFYIRGLECYPDNTVEIYNRWGVLVFERSGYNNSDRAFIGNSEGRVTVKQSEELPTGTYFYIFKYKDTDSNAHEKAGYLYLNR